MKEKNYTSKEFYIHVGQMKTGTTYLQQCVFPFLHDPNVYFSVMSDPIMCVLQKLITSNELNFEYDTSEKIIQEFCDTLHEKKILISYEALTGMPFTNFNNFWFIAESIKRIFKNVKIIMTIRKQDDFLQSLYIQNLHEGFSKSVKQFINYQHGSFGSYRPAFRHGVNLDVRQLNWMNFYEKYVSMFGSNSVLVLPYELLKKNKQKFVYDICKYIGIRYDSCKIMKSKNKNRSYSQISIYIALVLNRLVYNERTGFGIIVEKPFYDYLYSRRKNNVMLNVLYEITNLVRLRVFLQSGLDKILYIKPNVLNSSIRNAIMEFHYDNNKKLSNRANLNLEEYGYF